jgi:hypothetical protein
VRVRAEWLGRRPGHDLRFWGIVARRVRARRVRARDWARVREIAEQVERDLAATSEATKPSK